MSREREVYDEDAYVDVNSLPLRPPQPACAPPPPARRPWHPVMWDDSIAGLPSSNIRVTEEKVPISKEYPHKQRIRNLKRLIAEGKIKPSSETVIFFLCNKFAISQERQTQLALK